MRKKPAKAVKATRRITADRRELIRQLSEILYTFLPLSTRGQNTTTFRSIFAESHVAQYLEGEIKKKALQHAWEQIFRYHPRLPQKLIRKIVPAAVDYRRYKRNPLKGDELNALAGCLEKLGVDMRAELERIKLDESIPHIQVPPQELIKRLRNYNLKEPLNREPLDLFCNGHFNEAVRKACEKYEHRVQQVTKLNDYGHGLMSKTFGGASPRIGLSGLSTTNEKNIQEGYMHLAMGAMFAFRNIFSHGDEGQRSPEECYETLLFINWLFRHLP